MNNDCLYLNFCRDWNDMMSKKKNIGDILKNVGSKYDDGEMKINHVPQELSDEYSSESSCEDDSDDGGDGFFTNTNLEKFASGFCCFIN